MRVASAVRSVPRRLLAAPAVTCLRASGAVLSSSYSWVAHDAAARVPTRKWQPSLSVPTRHVHMAASVFDVHTVRVPTLGDSIPDAVLSEVEVEVGSSVEMDQVIAVLETDKVSFEVRADVAGVVTELLAAAGDTVTVGADLVRLEAGAATEAAAGAPADAAGADASTPAAEAPSLDEIDVVIPNLGDSIVDGTLSNVVAPAGTFVNMDDVVAEVDTDKVTSEVRAPVAGTVITIYASEGDTVQVGDNLFRIAPSGDAAPAAAAAASASPAATSSGASETTTPAPATDASPAGGRPHRIPSIRFRHGKRDAMPLPGAQAGAAAAAPYVPSAPVVSHQGTGDLAVTVATVGSFLDLPPMYGRPVFSDTEMDLVDSGGAAAF